MAKSSKSGQTGESSLHSRLLRHEVLFMTAIQRARAPGWAPFMKFLGELCTGEGIVGLNAALYWVFSQYLCVYGIWLVPVMEITNGIIKWIFRAPRPGWTHPQIKLLSWSQEYSFPSSHSQISFAYATFFAWASVGQLWIQAVCFTVALLVAYSRMFEGLHWPHDIVVGAMLGVLGAQLHITQLIPVLDAMFASEGLPLQWVLIAEGATLATLGVVIICYRITRHAQGGTDPKEWLETARSSHPRYQGRLLETFAVPMADYVGMCGVLGGLSVGEPLARLYPLEPPQGAAIALLRIVLGSLLLFGTFLGIRFMEKKVLQPASHVAGVARFFRYFLVPVIILEGAPLMFKTFGI